ncbi:hypothetical protein ACFYKX_11445 [Cytobacillus sp. FJAT-54145]|uniref:HNH endonuclease n=1 Tax=Cytobacillus spartinae TaxID=3299023 RepID=A0ABW6KD78_9BACI
MNYQLIVYTGEHIGKCIQTIDGRSSSTPKPLSVTFVDGKTGFVGYDEVSVYFPDATVWDGWRAREVLMARDMGTGSHHWKKHPAKTHACRVCGQYIENHEKHHLVIINGTPAKKADRFNFLIHHEEWLEIMKESFSFEEAVDKVFSKRQPKCHNRLQDDTEQTELVRKALSALGFIIVKETSGRLYFRNRGNRTARLLYDKKMKQFDYTGRANGLFDRLILNTVYDRIKNKMSEIQNQEQGV